MRDLVIITGVAGMVGSNLLEKIIKKRNQIIVGIDNYKLGKKCHIKKYLKYKNFFFFNIDLSKNINSKKLENLLKINKLKEAWLFAANSDISKGVSNPEIDIKNTFLSTFNTIQFINKYLLDNSKIYFTSTSAIYGEIKSKIEENTSPLNPISNYGSTKLASEAILSSYSHLNNCKIFIFRFPNVVGKNLTHGLLFDMKKKILNKKKFIQILGDGKQKKPYSHVSEILECMIYLSKKKYKSDFNVFNIGTNDSGMKVVDIVLSMLKKYGIKKKIKYQNSKIGWKGDVAKYRYSTNKINKIGFNFQMNSRMAILRAIDENL